MQQKNNFKHRLPDVSSQTLHTMQNPGRKENSLSSIRQESGQQYSCVTTKHKNKTIKSKSTPSTILLTTNTSKIYV